MTPEGHIRATSLVGTLNPVNHIGFIQGKTQGSTSQSLIIASVGRHFIVTEDRNETTVKWPRRQHIERYNSWLSLSLRIYIFQSTPGLKDSLLIALGFQQRGP